MTELKKLLVEYKERLVNGKYNDYASHLVDCADMIIDDIDQGISC